MSLIARNDLKKTANNFLKDYPVLAILGPRQCGKTTFARTQFPDFEYLDLELPSDLSKIESTPELYLKSRKKPLIIDEAQRFPELFPILRALVDQDRKNYGRFILLGSASFQLQNKLNESLSGRIAFIDLSPLTLKEIHKKTPYMSHWLKGGFPDALLQGESEALSFLWFEFYTRTLIESDLPSLGININPLDFRKLWKMCAQFHGSLLNKNKIATSMGISPNTVQKYISILEQSYVLKMLLPYHTNIKKRLVKSPKLYFRDSGMFHYFSGIKDQDALITSAEKGASFEGYIVEQITQQLELGTEAFFFRSSDGLEVDLLLKKGDQLIPIEIKCKLSHSEDDSKNIKKVMTILNCSKGFILNLSNSSYPVAENITVVGIEQWIADGLKPFWQKTKIN